MILGQTRHALTHSLNVQNKQPVGRAFKKKMVFTFTYVQLNYFKFKCYSGDKEYENFEVQNKQTLENTSSQDTTLYAREYVCMCMCACVRASVNS